MKKSTLSIVLLIVSMSFCDMATAQYVFDPVDTVWYNDNGQPHPWRLRPRTGTTDTLNWKLYFPLDELNDTTYASNDPSKRTKYYISNRLPGYLEFLPQNYDKTENANKLYPLLLFLPGCGEIQHGVLYLEPPFVDGNGVLNPARPSNTWGLGKFFGPSNFFTALPTELRDNGAYMSAVPVKTPGVVYNPTNGPTEGFIAMALMYRGDQGLCINVLSPTITDIDSAIDLAKKLYRVDPQRIYLTGLSNGGNLGWVFPASQTRNKLAATVPVCAYNENLTTTEGVQRIIDNQTHIFSVVNSYDYNTNNTGEDVITRTSQATDLMRGYPGGSNWLTDYRFLYTYQPPGLDKQQVLAGYYQNHDGWTRTYPTRYGGAMSSTQAPVYVDPATGDPYTIYEWMLLKRNTSVAIILPVHVTSFKAERVDEGVELNWVTSTESNSLEFILERSENGNFYSALATLPAAGNSSIERRYQYLDTKETQSRYLYYRLIQKDRDGHIEVIGIRKVFMGTKNISARLFPNVTSSTTTLEVSNNLREPLNLRIVDMSGRTLMRQVVPPRQPRTTLDISRLQKGVYVVEGQNQDNHFSLKLIKN